MQERQSWQIKDTHVLSELIALMNLSAEESRLLGSLHAQAVSIAPHMAEAFYERLLVHAQTAEYFVDRPMQPLHETIGQWFTDLFGGQYDEAYVSQRLRIGKVHVHVGLPVRYPLAMLDVVMVYGEEVTQRSTQPQQALQVLHKVLALDTAIFNQAYEDERLGHIAALVGGERLARKLLAGHM
ncbi:MAG: protoglobin domain-containing protein [Chloroflexota bacterium]